MSVFQKLTEVFTLNEATLSGCVDIIVVEQPDKSLKSSSFHVRFGKLKVLKTKEKIVTIKINDIEQKVHMKMDPTGEAYFEEIRDDTGFMDKLMSGGLSSDDGMSDYDVTHMQSDDEGGFDKEKINEQINKNTYRFDDLVSPKKETKETKVSTPQLAQTNEKQAAQQQNQSQQPEKKAGFWSNIFGLKKKDENVSNQASRKNSENVSVEELQQKMVVEQQIISAVKGEGKLEAPSTSAASQSVNSNNILSNSDIENEVDRFVINDVLKEKQQAQQAALQAANQVRNKGEIKNFKEDKYKMNEVVENLEKKQPQTPSSVNEKKIPLEVPEQQDKKDLQKTATPTNQVQLNPLSGSEKKIEEPKKDSKIEMKDLIDSKKDINQLIAARKAEKSLSQLQQETPQIKELKEEVNEEEEEEEEEDEEEIGLSLCNNVQSKKGQENKSLDELFEEYKVTYEQFSQDPLKILNDKNLLLKIGYHLYPWEIAASILVCRLAFKQEIPENTLQNMIKQQKKKSSSGFLHFLFRRNKNELTPQKKPAEAPEIVQTKDKAQRKDLSQLQINSSEKTDQIVSPIQSPKSGDDLEQQRYRKMSDELSAVSESTQNFGKIKIRKTLKPKSDILKSFNLKPGPNKVSYTVTTTLQGDQTLEGYIFLWPNNVQIVISDIDGTITKSDIFGQILPMVDKEWTHEVKNGYQMLYLTARAIGQSEQTRKFIYTVKQGTAYLPLGPVIMSQDRLLKSFKREVIDRKPEVFKIAVLREIQQLFPNKNVYYAGFGNRETDCVAYRAVQVNIQKIYITNPATELHQINNTFKKTYHQLNDMIDSVFPPRKADEDNVQDDYNNFNFWHIKPPAIQDISSFLVE